MSVPRIQEEKRQKLIQIIVDVCSDWDTPVQYRTELNSFLRSLPKEALVYFSKLVNGRYYKRQQVWIVNYESLPVAIYTLRNILKDAGYSLPRLFCDGDHAFQSCIRTLEASGVLVWGEFKTLAKIKASVSRGNNRN